MKTDNALLHLLSTINDGKALEAFGEEFQRGVTLLGIQFEKTQQPVVGQVVLRVQFEINNVRDFSDAGKGVQIKVSFTDLRVKEGPLEQEPPPPPKPLMGLPN